MIRLAYDLPAANAAEGPARQGQARRLARARGGDKNPAVTLKFGDQNHKMNFISDTHFQRLNDAEIRDSKPHEGGCTLRVREASER